MRLRMSALSLLMAFLTTPALAVAQEHGGESEGGLFSINLGLSIWTVVIFVALLIVLRRFAWGPILSAVEAREKGIQDSLDEARARQAEAEALLEAHRKQLAEARLEAQEIIGQGREAAERVRKEMDAKAREESELILTRARAEIEREKDAAVDAIRRESVDLALAAASKLLHQKLDSDQDRKLIADYLDGLTDRGPGAQA